MTTINLQSLMTLSPGLIFRAIRRWCLRRAEGHYLICAAVEQDRANEHQANVAYYQRKAAMAKSHRLSV